MAKFSSRINSSTPGTFKTSVKIYDQSKLSSWQYANKSALDILNEYQEKIKRGDWLSTEDRQKYKSAVDTYTSTGNSLRQASKHYGQKYTADEEKSWNDSLSSLQSGYSSVNDFYNQFGDETTYGYFSKRFADDYADKSKYVSTKYGDPHLNIFSGTYDDTGFGDIEYDYINKNTDAANIKLTNDTVYGYTLAGTDKSERFQMTEDEIGLFNYIYKTEGKDAAYAFVDYLESDLNARQRQATQDAWAKYANEKPFESSVFSILTSPMKGVSYIGQAADFIDDGKIDQNAGYNKYSYINSAIRNQVSQQIEASGKWGQVGSFAYQTGMSMGDFLFNTAITGGNQALSLALMGTGAAADTTISAKDRGLEDWQAFTLGTIAGAAEIVMEKIGLDALFDTALLGKNALGYVIKNALSEGGEEVGSSLINTLADVIVAGDKSEWQTSINNYMSGGMDETEAFWHAVGDQALSLGADFLGGAISGGVMGGVGAGIHSAGVAIEGSKIKDSYLSNPGLLTDVALSYDPSNSYAQKMQSKIAKGGELSNYQLGKLAGQIQSGMIEQDTAKIRTAAESRLTELGETGDVSAIADAIARETVGEELSFKDRAVLNKSTKANIVLTEMMPENIKGGNLANKWAEGIGTKRVNADVYNLREATDTPKAKGSTETKIGVPTGDVEAVIEQAAKDKVGKIDGFTEETANVMVRDYDGSVPPSEYVTTFEEAFKLGRDNAQVKELTRLSKDSGVIGRALLHAYDAGLQSRNVASKATNPENSVLQNGTESAIINTESESITNEGKTGTEGIRLRNGGKWFGGKNTEGQIRRMEGGAGQNPQWREGRSRPADREAARLLDEGRGREVTVAQLGILHGSKQQKVWVIDEQDYTPEIKEAVAEAEAQGLTAKVFVGDDILIEEANGSISGAHAYILGKQMLIRADHEKFTSKQFARHEIGHDKIAKGQVDIKAVRKRLEETVGKEAIDSVAQAYAEAYGRTGLNADEIWEECICDSLGDMNIFTAIGISGREGRVTDRMLAEIKAATEGYTTNNGGLKNDQQGSKIRGTEGKASRSLEGTPPQNGDGRNVSEASGREQNQGKEILSISNKGFGIRKLEFPNEAYTKARKNTVEYEEGKILDGYGIEWYVVKPQYWNKKSPAWSHEGVVYFKEGLPEKFKGALAEHEAVHVMRHLEYTPYIEFIEKTPQNMDISSADALEIIQQMAEEYNIDIMNATGEEIETVYDEINAALYGGSILFVNNEEYLDYVRSGFDDYDAHLKELTTILEQFKSYNKQGKASRELDLEDFDYSQIYNMRVEANKVREDIKKIEKSEDFKAQMDKLTQAVDSGDAEGGIAAYNEWKKSSGYGELITKRDQLEAAIEKYSKAYEDNRVNRALNEEAEAIKKSGLSEADYFRKEAEKVFGYTPYFYDAGYIVPNGKMLNFSGEKGKHFGSRGEDHRAIGQIYANTQGGKALTRFMNDGNIRIMAESPGLDIASKVEPSREQYSTIRSFIYDSANREYFNVDISDESGRVIGSLKYDGKINPTRIINDIKHYYETGEIRDQSEIDKFRYSRELDFEYLSAVENGDMKTAQRMVDEAAKAAGYDSPKLYHGTKRGGFTVFDDTKNDLAQKGFFFTSSPDVAKSYFKSSDGTLYAGYIRMEHPLIVEGHRREWNNLKFDIGDAAKNYKAVQRADGWWEIHTVEGRVNIENTTRWATEEDAIDAYKAAPYVHPTKTVLNTTRDIVRYAYNNGDYDGVIIKDTIDMGDIRAKRKISTLYIPFNSNQIKSADPVTYDDTGMVIPLSERFNPKNSDIRYSRELDLIDYVNDKADGKEYKPLTNRELLASALESVATNDAEREKLKQYKDRVDMLNRESLKLYKINEEIKELIFGKGNKNPARLKELKEEAIKTSNRINLHDKKLLSLEATKSLKDVLDREKKKAYKAAAEKGREALHRNVEGRHKTAERHGILKDVRELDKLLNRGTKERNVKKGASALVRSALDLSDMLFATDDELILNGMGTDLTKAESQAIDDYLELYEEYHSYDGAVTENKGKRAELRSQMHDLKENFEGALERERKRISEAKASDTYDALIAEYKKLEKSDDDYIKLAYRPEVAEYLESLKADVGENTIVSEMTLDQLKKLHRAFSMIKHMVSESNKLFRDGKRVSYTDMVNTIFKDVDNLKNRFGGDYPEIIGKALDKINEFGWNNLRPVDAFELVGSEAFGELFWDNVKSQNVYAKDIEEVAGALIKARNKYGYKNWDIEKSTSFRTADGRSFNITLGEMMSIYAYSKRAQADAHMRDGGFQHEKKATYKDKNEIRRKRAKAPQTYRVHDKMRIEIINALTKQQRAYVDEMQALLTKFGEKGNEASRILYGIDLFTEDVYFPLMSSNDYLSSVSNEIGKTVTTASLANTGMTKATVPNASNPIILRAFDDVLLEHFDKMSKYHAYVVPIDNLRKVFDGQSKSANGDMLSIKALISSKLGNGASEYFKDYITDLNGSATISGAKNPLESFFGKSKGAAVAANISVWVQQYFSVIRAFSEVNPRYFLPFMGESYTKVDMKLYDEMKKYAPITTIKEMGGFDVGSNRGITDYIGYDGAKFTTKKAWKKFQDAMGIGAEAMDKLGWMTIWKGVKKEVAATGKYKSGSEAYFKACGERFEQIIAKTQVYDSVNAKSGLMRAKNPAVKYIVSFMGEPTTIVGMVETSIVQFERAAASKDKAKMKVATARLVSTVASVVVANAMTSVAKALVYGMRDDDEDETYLEKYAEALGKAFRDDINLLNYFPIARDIASILEGYDVERPDMTLIADVVTSFRKAIDSISDEEVEGSEKHDKAVKATLALANMLGIPAKTIYRDIDALVKMIKSSANEYRTDFGIKFTEGFKGEELNKGEKLYQSIIIGDTKLTEYYKSTYKDENTYLSAVRKALRENDPRLKEAAIAKLNGDEDTYWGLFLDVVEEGKFEWELIEAAFKAEYNSQKNKADEEGK